MINRSFIFFDSEGCIYRHTSGTSEVHEGPDIIEVPAEVPMDYFNCYVVDGDILVRPTFSLEVSQNPFRITGIPEGTLVSYPGGEIVVDDGFIEWSSVEPGEYRFELSNFPYIDEVVYAHITDV